MTDRRLCNARIHGWLADHHAADAVGHHLIAAQRTGWSSVLADPGGHRWDRSLHLAAHQRNFAGGIRIESHRGDQRNAEHASG